MGEKSILCLGLEDWVQEQKRLLVLEKASEIQQTLSLFSKSSADTLESLGVSLSRVTVLDITSGLFGRTILRFGDPYGRPLPAHKFTNGDIVGIRTGGKALSLKSSAAGDALPLRKLYDANGVVTSADDTSVSVALDEAKDLRDEDAVGTPSLGDRVGIDKLGDDVTMTRLTAVLDDLLGYRHGPASKLLRLLFPAKSAPTSAAVATPEFCDVIPPPSTLYGPKPPCPLESGLGFTPFRQGLNSSQTDAIVACLRAKDVCMIHGPPGTGKTTTVVEYIMQEVSRGRRVLACAPSNVAVDNILERLVACTQVSASKLMCVRLGHPARVSSAMLEHSLDAHVQRSEGSAIVADVRRDLLRVQDEVRRVGRKDKAKRAQLRAEERSLKKEVRAREERVVANTLRSADVVLCTVTGAATKVLRKALLECDKLRSEEVSRSGGFGAETSVDDSLQADGEGGSGNAERSSRRWFDVVVVDEVAQSSETAVYIPALLGKKLVVAGDHCQLPPTVISQEAAAQGLAVTLADRLVALFDPRPSSPAPDGPTVHIPWAVLARLPKPPPTAMPVVHMLTVQYRMNAAICSWASAALYGGRLVAHPSVAAHVLSGLPPVALMLGTAGIDQRTGEAAIRVQAASVDAVRTAAAVSARESRLAALAAPPALSSSSKGAGRTSASSSAMPSTVRLMDASTAAAVEAQALGASDRTASPSAGDLYLDIQSLTSPLLLVDSAGCGMGEAVDAASGSASNVREADVAVKHVLGLLAAGLQEKEVAVVTPYNAQVSLLRAMLGPSHPGVEVRTVDGFQGQEKEAIVLCLVRSNALGNVGFLADFRRINVAVTRARRHAAVIGDSDTINRDPFLKGLLAHIGEHGQVRSASGYDDTIQATASGVSLGGGGFEEALGGRKSSIVKVRQNQPDMPRKGESERKARDSASTLNATKRVVDGRIATAVLRLLRLQLRSFMRACDEGAPDLAGTAMKLRTLPLAALAAAAVARPDVDVSMQKELAVAGGAVRAHAFSETGTASVGGVRLQLLFPSSLSPLHRALVHRAATDLGLLHASQGDGEERAITVEWLPAESRAVRKASTLQGLPTGTSLSPAQRKDAGTLPGDESVHSTVVEGAQAEQEQSWVQMLATLDLDPEDFTEDDLEVEIVAGEGVGDAAPIDVPIATAAAILSQNAGKMPVLEPHPSLLAQLAAARRLRDAQRPPHSQLLSSVAIDDHEDELSVKPSGKSEKGKAKKGKSKDEGGGSASNFHPPMASDGIRREFGVPVAPLKPLLAATIASTALPKAKAEGEDYLVLQDAAGSSKSKGKKGKKVAVEDGEDLDMALLDAVIAQSKSCAVKACKQSTQTTGTTCLHCNMRYCYGHGMPEVHGCGDEARKCARRKWVDAQGALTVSGGGGTPAPLAEWKRDTISSKLHKKLDGAAEERAPRKNAKDGKGYSAYTNYDAMADQTTGHKLDAKDHSYKTQAGSNYLAARRFAEQSGLSEEDLWGPAVHGSEPDAISRNKARSEFERLELAAATSARDRERASAYPTAGSSNFLCGERMAEKEGMSREQLWGPGTHDQRHPAAYERHGHNAPLLSRSHGETPSPSANGRHQASGITTDERASVPTSYFPEASVTGSVTRVDVHWRVEGGGGSHP